MQNLNFNDLPGAVSQILVLLSYILELLKNQVPQQPKEEPDELLNVRQAARFLGISVSTVYTKSYKGELPVCKPPKSKRIYFSKKDLNDFIRAGRVKTNSEIKAGADDYLSKKGGSNE